MLSKEVATLFGRMVARRGLCYELPRAVESLFGFDGVLVNRYPGADSGTQPTKGSRGGKLPSGKLVPRFPSCSISAASR